jgi:hypothetical protein
VYNAVVLAVFAYLYSTLLPDAAEFDVPSGDKRDIGSAVYYAVATHTTVGYGDIVARSGARADAHDGASGDGLRRHDLHRECAGVRPSGARAVIDVLLSHYGARPSRAFMPRMAFLKREQGKC